MDAICGTVLVVDEDARDRALLSGLLARAGFAVREGASGEDALREAFVEKPSVVILDVNIPGVSGYVVCRLLREKFGESLGIVFISGRRVEPFDRTAGFLLGADDYVVKPFDPDELIAHVRRLAARSRAEDILPADQSRRSRIKDFELTPREQEVLGLLVDGLNQVEIARRLVISPNTVATHIQRILLKLGVHSRAQAVALAAREGFFVRAGVHEEPNLTTIKAENRKEPPPLARGTDFPSSS